MAIGRINATLSGVQPGGLAKIVPTSVAVGSGSGSSNTNGLVSFSGASSVSLNGCFSSAYENYRVLLRLTSISADQAIYLKMRASGTDNSTAYYYIGYGASGTTTVYTGGATNQTTGHFIGNTDGASNKSYYGWDTHLFDPFTAKPTPFITNYTGITTAGLLYGMTTTGWHDVDVSYDGISIIASTGNITGTLSVYGYN